MQKIKGNIDFKNVSFDYGMEGQPVFKDFSVDIPSQQKVAIVGYSGAGKSTFVNLLLRLFDPSSGQVCFDGQDISNFSQDSVRQHLAMIPQDTSLFHRSVMENIRYSRPDATDEEVIEACKKASAHQFIKGLKDGYETLVGERGVKLSGGQRQRIAIARALLRNSTILILDEATSALDSQSEKEIQQSLLKAMKDKTVIAIAHRLSTISHMDRILVLDKGVIVEDGTHDELLEKNGIYANMWKLQSGGFLAEE